MSRVFISHSSRDRDLVEREVIEPLRQHGIETWYSKDDIETAADWEKSIRQGLNECEWFVVVLTSCAVGSRWVKIEVDWALENRPNRVIPVLLEDCRPNDLHIGLRLTQHVDFRHNTEQARARLLTLLTKRPAGVVPNHASRIGSLRRVVFTALTLVVLLTATLSLYWFLSRPAQIQPPTNDPVTDNASAKTTGTQNESGANPSSTANTDRQGNRAGPTVIFKPLPQRIPLSNTGGGIK
jgi:hypothetical protein